MAVLLILVSALGLAACGLYSMTSRPRVPRRPPYMVDLNRHRKPKINIR